MHICIHAYIYMYLSLSIYIYIYTNIYRYKAFNGKGNLWSAHRLDLRLPFELSFQALRL